MSEETAEQSVSSECWTGPAAVGPPNSAASLLSFPPKLQEVVSKAILKAKPQRATDIWYEDKTTGKVLVMRQGFEWQLNETASELWLRAGEQVQDVVQDLCKKSPDSDPHEIQLLVAEFLLQASSYGLLELFPEQEMKRSA